MDSDDVSNSSNNDSKTEETDSIKKIAVKIESVYDESSKSSVASETPEKKKLKLRPIDQLLSPRVKLNKQMMQTIDLLSDDEDDDNDIVMFSSTVQPCGSSKSQKISSKRSGSEALLNTSSNSEAASSLSNLLSKAPTSVFVTLKQLPKNLQPLMQKHKLKEIVNEKQKVIASISGTKTIDLKKRIQNEVKNHLK